MPIGYVRDLKILSWIRGRRDGAFGYLACPAKPALTEKGVLTIYWKLEILILFAYILHLSQGKRSIRLQKSRDLQWALVNIHSNRCHMIKPIVFELSLYQLKISGSELTVSVMSKWPASGKEKGNPVFDCLPKRAFRAYFATRDCSALFHSKIVCFGHIMTRFVQSRRLKFWDPSSSTTFFCAVPVKLVFVLANIKKKKQTWPISAILTLRFVNKLKAKIVRAG